MYKCEEQIERNPCFFLSVASNANFDHKLSSCSNKERDVERERERNMCVRDI